MCVAYYHSIHPREIMDAAGYISVTFMAKELYRGTACTEDGVSQDGQSLHLDEHRGMANPSSTHTPFGQTLQHVQIGLNDGQCLVQDLKK